MICLALLAWSVPAFAQVDAAIATVKNHFVENEARYGASSDDLAELAVTDAYTSRRTNATYVYLKQAHNGIEVYNATAQAVVTSNNQVAAPHARFISDLANRVNADSPTGSPEGAASSAARHLRFNAADWWVDSRLETDAPDDDIIASDYLTYVPDSGKLVYLALENGNVRLAWDISLDSKDGQHYFSVRVDALNGRVLEYADLVNHDTWGSFFKPASDEVVPNFAPIASSAAAGGPEYRVYAIPCESPGDCSRTLEFDPATTNGSPLGWHDNGSASFTTTQGNNAHAYTDTDANNSPDPGSSPDGGGGLSFDFPIDILADPTTWTDASVTNLFYWNNVFHDVTYQYGFDEAGGNFQENNFGNGGLGSDYVNAEGRDGSGTCNANFFTPSDGGNPRMQMYLCPSGIDSVRVNAPAPIAGNYLALIAGFGPTAPPGSDFSGDVELVDDGSGEPTRGCGALIGFTPGRVALVQRGDCEFGTKVLNAENAGAIGAIVYNCVPGSAGCSTNSPGEAVITMGAGADGGSVTIPSYMVFNSTGQAMIDQAPTTVSVDAFRGEAFTADTNLDNGIVVHEYGHGLSNRLTGGPGSSGCLSNQEQMGEGWSDYYAVALTMKPGQTGATPRPVGSYGLASPNGIRPAPYSTDFAVNSATYQDSRTQAVPHGVGWVWASAIWEMTWELINTHGFDPDVYDADGTAGNQIAIQLVTEGMKLQPCSPGFVDGRNAILEADQLLYGGANTDLLWAAFARRGLGLFADQGSSGTNADNTEDFTVPSGEPEPVVDPTSITVDVQEDDTEVVGVSISNVGGAELTWSLSAPPSWLSYSSSGGSISPGDDINVNFTMDATGLDAGAVEMTTVTMTTNAPGGGASIDIDVTMNVISPVANEAGMDFPGTHLLSEAYPNPFNPTATFSLAVAEPQEVQIALYDVRGRLISMLNEGALSGRTLYTFTIDGANLTSGTYFVRISGETFADNHRITLLK